jgi:hypothetical protein
MLQYYKNQKIIISKNDKPQLKKFQVIKYIDLSA